MDIFGIVETYRILFVIAGLDPAIQPFMSA